jgi:hypothetical protein
MRILLVTVLAALLAPSAAAAADLPLTVDGVRATQGSGGVKIVFGPKAKGLYKKIAGRKVTVDCETVLRTDGPVLGRDDGGGEGLTSVLVAAKKRRALRLGERSGRFDTCRLSARRTKKLKNGGKEVRIVLDLRVPLTQKGAVFLDESRMAIVLDDALGLVEPAKGQTNYRSAQDGIASAGGEGGIVVLDSPDATPPADRLGLYSDGVAHAAAVAVTKAGRRVFIEVDGDALKTNLTSVLFSG